MCVVNFHLLFKFKTAASKTASAWLIIRWSSQTACVQDSHLTTINQSQKLRDAKLKTKQWISVTINRDAILTGRLSGLEGSERGSIMVRPSLSLWARVRKIPSTWSATESSLALVSKRGIPRSSAQRWAVLVVTTWSPWDRSYSLEYEVWWSPGRICCQPALSVLSLEPHGFSLPQANCREQQGLPHW